VRTTRSGPASEPLVVDLSGVTFIDVRTYATLAARANTAVVNLSAPTQRLADVLGALADRGCN
jgi:anti-anti-sigma regulatory factor